MYEVISREDFPSCCQIDILHRFGNDGANYGTSISGQRERQLESDLYANIQRMNGTFLIAALNHNQYNFGIGRVLEGCGFKMVSAGEKASHNGQIFLYAYTPRPFEEKKPKAAPRRKSSSSRKKAPARKTAAARKKAPARKSSTRRKAR